MTSDQSPPTVADIPAAALLDVRAIAMILGCSSRHVYRMSDSGAMPRPVRLSVLVRWRKTDIERWIADGCPSCRQARGGVR